MREHWQPKITSLPVPVGGLPGAAARSRGLPCRRAREATVILGRLVQTQADFLVRCCWSWRCPTPGHVPGAVPSPCFFQSHSVEFRRHYSASLKKTKTKPEKRCEMEKGCFNKMSQKKVFSSELHSLMSECGQSEETKGRMFLRLK